MALKLSVACSFEPGLIDRLAAFPEVTEVYGRMDHDVVGGGRAAYTLRRTGRRAVESTVATAHRRSMGFNYLINGATLDGTEQTAQGRRSIRRLLDWLAAVKVDSVTVSVPYLLRLVKRHYPQFKVRVGVFARVATPSMARQWEEMGADTLCISAIACNRDFGRLRLIREAVSCDLQLIANANCLCECSHELTHMNLLTAASRSRDRLGGFCLDHCFVHCSSRKVRDPVHYIRSTWIRPEDLHLYENIGYSNFKLVERSCPADLMVRRVEAYARRSFDGNLMALVAPVANIKKEQGASFGRRLRMMLTMLRPDCVNVPTLLTMKAYAEAVIIHDYAKGASPVYIDNRSLDGFLEGFIEKPCTPATCTECGYCRDRADKAVEIDEEYRDRVLELAGCIGHAMVNG